jgi:DNA polymerase
LLGEAPGRHEDEGGEPFIGRSGQLLFTLIHEELKLTREDCFVTNVVKCRPPENRTPTRVEIAACQPWLELQLGEISSHVVIPLGLTATRTLLASKATMSELHGRAVTQGSFRVVPTYHPAAALRQGPSVVAMMRDDLRVVRGLLHS